MFQDSREIENVINLDKSKFEHFFGIGGMAPIGLKDPAFDPFVTFTSNNGSKPGGIPDHPHKNVEGIAYVIEGNWIQEDSLGKEIKLGEGEAIYFNASTGLSHAMVPQSENMNSEVFVMSNYLPPNKRTNHNEVSVFRKEDFPVFDDQGVRLTVLSGLFMHMKGPIPTKDNIAYFDLKLMPGAKFENPMPSHYNIMATVLKGKALIGPNQKPVLESTFVTLKSQESNKIAFEAGNEGARVLIVAGEPTQQNIYKHGFFVGATKEEAEELEQQYYSRSGPFANAWKSKISQTLTHKEITQKEMEEICWGKPPKETAPPKEHAHVHFGQQQAQAQQAQAQHKQPIAQTQPKQPVAQAQLKQPWH